MHTAYEIENILIQRWDEQGEREKSKLVVKRNDPADCDISFIRKLNSLWCNINFQNVINISNLILDASFFMWINFGWIFDVPAERLSLAGFEIY